MVGATGSYLHATCITTITIKYHHHGSIFPIYNKDTDHEQAYKHRLKTKFHNFKKIISNANSTLKLNYTFSAQNLLYFLSSKRVNSKSKQKLNTTKTDQVALLPSSKRVIRSHQI